LFCFDFSPAREWRERDAEKGGEGGGPPAKEWNERDAEKGGQGGE
jgi:hypothetical protein